LPIRWRTPPAGRASTCTPQAGLSRRTENRHRPVGAAGRRELPGAAGGRATHVRLARIRQARPACIAWSRITQAPRSHLMTAPRARAQTRRRKLPSMTMRGDANRVPVPIPSSDDVEEARRSAGTHSRAGSGDAVAGAVRTGR
jgi:hypothetical protein